MTREQVKELLPIIQAYTEGKVIEQRCAESWIEVDEDCDFHFPANSYRIKPEFKYRPFKGMEECLKEMQKHQPFGWIESGGYWYNIISTDVAGVKIINTKGAIVTLLFSTLLSQYKFVDGTLLGIKIKE